MKENGLTPIQKDLLRMFSFDHSDSFALEIKNILSQHFLNQIDNETNRLWDEGLLDQQKLNELRRQDLHSDKYRNYGRIGHIPR